MQMWETRVQSLGQEDRLEEEMAIPSRILARKSHGQKSLMGYSQWGLKTSDRTERLNTICLVLGSYESSSLRPSRCQMRFQMLEVRARATFRLQ